MSFIAPWFLLGLLGISIPLALHMIRRQKAEKIAFSTVRFLKKTPKKMILIQEVQQWLLLLVRIAIVALLAFAFARPFFSGTFSNLVGASPQSVVILVDTSMSMQYDNYFERAKESAIEVLQSLQAGDEAAIITFSDSTRRFKELTSDLTDLETFVRSLQSPDYQTTRFQPALRFANQILRSAHFPDKTVFLISDYQRQAFDNFDPLWKLSAGVKFEGIKIGEEETINLAVTDVKAPAQIVRDQEEHLILSRIRNYGSRHLDEAQVSLKIDETIVETKTVDLSEKSEAVVEFYTSFKDEGNHLGSIIVEDTQFTPDNNYYFTINVRQPMEVLVINGESSVDWYQDESYWFRLALGKPGQSPFRFDGITPQQMNPNTLNQYDVLVLLNVKQLNPEQIRAVQTYVKKGGSLLLAPADQVNAESFNRIFGSITPALLNEQPTLLENDYLVIAEVNRRHSILQSLQNGERSDWEAAHFQGFWPTEPVKGSEVLMRFDNGEAALIERNIDEGRVLLFPSSLDVEWNNLPLQGLYLPLIHETLRYLALHIDKKHSYTIGKPVSLVVPARTLIRIQEPSGKETELTTKPGDRPFYHRTGTPGFYSVQARNFQDYFAININAEESDLTTIALTSVQDQIVNSETKQEEAVAVNTPTLSAQLEKSQRFWWWLLLIVFLLGIGETLLANRTYR